MDFMFGPAMDRGKTIALLAQPHLEHELPAHQKRRADLRPTHHPTTIHDVPAICAKMADADHTIILGLRFSVERFHLRSSNAIAAESV